MEDTAFILDDEGTGWPPASVEWLYLENLGAGHKVKTLPLFVKDMAVDDVVSIEKDEQGQVFSWSHIQKSNRSTIWVMVHGKNDISGVLKALRALGCNTASLTSHNYFAVDVPEEVRIDKVDDVLATVDEVGASVVFSAFRH